MKNKKKIGLACLLGVALIIMGVSIYGILKGREDVQELVEVESYTIPTLENIFVNGSVAPKEVESFGMNMSLGSVETIHVKDGDRVSVGDTIVTYKRDGVGEQVEALESQLEAVRKAKNSSEESPSRQGHMSREAQIQALQGLEGLEGLDGLNLDDIDLDGLGLGGDMPAMDYDAQIASLEGQISKLREMERSVETSGIDGIAYIEETSIQEGIRVERVLVRSEEFVAVGSVNEKSVLKLSEGMKAEITLLANDVKLDGEIESVAQRPGSGSSDLGSIDINSAIGGSSSGGDNLSSYDIVFRLKEQVELLEGFSVQARIPLDDDSIIIPESAIASHGDEQYVYVIRDGITERVAVKAVLSSELKKQEEVEGEGLEQDRAEELEGIVLDPGKALVLSGLGHGDEIVISDISSLSGGERVE